jgi:hypothetical protein
MKFGDVLDKYVWTDWQISIAGSAVLAYPLGARDVLVRVGRLSDRFGAPFINYVRMDRGARYSAH